MNLRATIALVLGIVALAWYYICLYRIGFHNTTTGAFRDFMSLSITTIGAALATFVGGLLGVRQIAEAAKKVDEPPAHPPMPALGDQQNIQRPHAVAETQVQRLAQRFVTTHMQWIAALAYIASLVLALWIWSTDDQADAAITNLGKTLLGLIGGALAIVLNAPAERQ